MLKEGDEGQAVDQKKGRLPGKTGYYSYLKI
jgi:hypothetical protein